MVKPRSRSSFVKNGQVRYSEARDAWVRVLHHELTFFDGSRGPINEEDPATDETTRVIGFSVAGRQPVYMKLSNMTAEELEALRAFFLYALDSTQPICERLDREAQEASRRGDTANSRIYRAVPQFIVRPRAQPEHDSGVPSGPDGVAGVDTDERRPALGDYRDFSGYVPDRAPQDLGAQDD